MSRTPGPWPIREVSGDCSLVTIGQQPISFVNHEDARLIAASPLLLEALKEFEKAVRDKVGILPEFIASYAKVRSALARAEGRQL